MLVPAVLMVSTIRFRSFKTIDLQARRSYKILLGVAIGYFAITTHPRWTLVVLAYGYLASAFVGDGHGPASPEAGGGAGEARRRPTVGRQPAPGGGRHTGSGPRRRQAA